MVRDAVDFVIRGHHTSHVRPLHCGAERHEERLAQIPFRKICRSSIGTALWLAMCGKMLRRRQHVMSINLPRGSLQAVDGRHSHVGNEIRIFAVSFFGPSPARIARQIQHRREGLIHAGGSHLVASHLECLLHEFGIPRARQAQHLRKAGAAVGHESMQSFALENCGNA